MNNRIQSTNQLRTESPRRVGGGRHCLMALVTGLAVSATGCGADESPNVGSSQAALSESSCASVVPDQNFSRSVDPKFVTPSSSYDTCDKGYVIDLWNLDVDYTGEGNVRYGRIAVTWEDSLPTSPEECWGSQLQALFYEWNDEDGVGGGHSEPGPTQPGSADWHFLEAQTQYGTWGYWGDCLFELNFAPHQAAGKSYRIAATARTPDNETRKLGIQTHKPISREGDDGGTSGGW